VRKSSPSRAAGRAYRKLFALAGEVAVLFLCLGGVTRAETLTLPADRRPDWLRQDGIVMAGSWEPLLFRVRRDGGADYVPSAEQRAAYRREHSPEMVARLKDLGVNFVMMHCYKGTGTETEHESMRDAVAFARLCHDAGLRVGVYAYSGAFLWEPFFREVPSARDWVLLDETGKPTIYGGAPYRYFWNRTHPAAQAFYRTIVSFAVREIGTDLVHLDNYHVGPGWDGPSVACFRRYLGDTFTAEQLRQAGVDDVNAVQPPRTGSGDSLLRRAWLDFSCRSLADSYHDMSRHARTLRPDILMECNPGGPGNSIQPPVDHGRLLQGGEAFWDEGQRSGYYNGRFHTRIRTYKVARAFNNMAFAYTTTPLEMAESMAFNQDCLGCVCWFEYAELVALPGSKAPVSPALSPFIRFFHARRDLFRDTRVVADVAVLRSFPSQVFADPKHAQLTSRVEQTLIDNHIPFQIIYNEQLGNLSHYRALILAGVVALSDAHLRHIRDYVTSGGRLCLIGPTATHDEWLLPRPTPALADLPASQVVQTTENDSIPSAIRRACDGQFALSVPPDPGLACELTEQSGRRLVHLVNYRPDPAGDVAVSVRLRGRAKSVTLVSPEQHDGTPLPFQAREGRVEFNVPEVRVYEIAVVEEE
jgi:hypothetical protein